MSRKQLYIIHLLLVITELLVVRNISIKVYCIIYKCVVCFGIYKQCLILTK